MARRSYPVKAGREYLDFYGQLRKQGVAVSHRQFTNGLVRWIRETGTEQGFVRRGKKRGLFDY